MSVRKLAVAVVIGTAAGYLASQAVAPSIAGHVAAIVSCVAASLTVVLLTRLHP